MAYKACFVAHLILFAAHGCASKGLRGNTVWAWRNPASVCSAKGNYHHPETNGEETGLKPVSSSGSGTGLNNSYTYDADGLRLTKTVNGVQHKYVWQGSQLVAEYYGGTELEFFYDESGAPYAFSYKASASATPVMY